MKKENYFILLSLLSGILYTLLFYNKEAGISYPIYIIWIIVLLIFSMKIFEIPYKKYYWFFGIPLILLSLQRFLSANSFLHFFNQLIIIGLFVGMSILLIQERKNDWGSLAFFIKILSILFTPVIFFYKPYEWIFQKIKSNPRSRKNGTLFKVLLGLLISLPLLGIILILLSSADQVFGNLISSFSVNLEDFDEFIQSFVPRFILTLLIGTYIYSYIYTLFVNNRNEKKEILLIKGRYSIDSTILITILTMCNLIYILFSVIQFSYLFCDSSGKLPGGLTYAAYARRGFFELLVVSVINFCLILISLFLLPKESKITDSVIKFLLTLMGVATFIMLYSSFYRMRLYEQNYGYTILRLLVYFFLLTESIFLAQTLYYIYRPQFHLGKTLIISGLILYLGLNYINIDAIIARNNINRYMEIGKIDLNYLRSLSYDSVPEMKKLLGSKDQQVVQEVESYFNHIEKKINVKQSWTSYNYSKYRAKYILDEINNQ